MEAHALRRQSAPTSRAGSRRLLSAFSDERLIAQLRHGNEAAFEVLYDRHHAGVFSYCRHMVRSQHDAEDALQQTFVSAHRDLVGSDKAINFKPWVYTIARNRCLSMLTARRDQPSDKIECISTAGLSEEVQERADLRDLVGDLQELPHDQRTALVLSELGDLSHTEIAAVIGCKAAKVKALVFQARSGLLERRRARETPCAEIREQLAVLHGPALRRGPLRRHLKACPGCAEFREDVKRQRQMLAVVVPVVPALGLKESALAAIGSGTAASAGGLAATGGLTAVMAGKVGAAKLAVIAAAAAGGVAGGGVAVESSLLKSDPVATDPAGRTEREVRSFDTTEGARRPNRPGGAEVRDRRNQGQPGERGNARDFAGDRGQGKHLGLEKTPPGYGKSVNGDTAPGRDGTAPGHEKTPPGQEKTPPAQEKTPPVQEKAPPGQGKIPPGQTRESAPLSERPQKPLPEPALQAPGQTKVALAE